MRQLTKFNALGSLLLVFLMSLAIIITLLPHLLGLTIAVIRDDAMQSTYPNGSLVFVRQQAVKDINVGEIITYYVNQGEEVMTRRVVAKDAEEEVFYTKGDKHDQSEAGKVTKRNLLGQPIFHLAYLGFLATDDFVSYAQGLFWIIAGGLTLYSGLTLTHKVRSQKKVNALWEEQEF